MMNFFQRYLNLVYVSPRLITCVLDSNNNKGCETHDELLSEILESRLREYESRTHVDEIQVSLKEVQFT
jgi:hypothetical protein